MPPALSNQNNYYAAHHRRQSAQSQTNLPDQVRDSPSQIHSPNRSLVYLPSTTYSHQQPMTQSASSASRPNPRPQASRGDEVPSDPHDFYRQYQDQFTNSSPIALHQDAIRATTFVREEEDRSATQEAIFVSAHSNGDISAKPVRTSISSRKLSLNTQNIPNGAWDRTPTKPSTVIPTASRSRKASFKDLVARFDASPEEVPPMPNQQISRPNSTTTSPMTYAAMETLNNVAQQKRPGLKLSEPSRKVGTGASASSGMKAMAERSAGRSRGFSSTAAATKATNDFKTPDASRKFLFGEVVPTTLDVPAAGYGINTARRRRGSEGSPMHSPNPMFPSNPGRGQAQGESTFAENMASQGQSRSHVGRTNGSIDGGLRHRRANSDFTGPVFRPSLGEGQSPSPTGRADAHSNLLESSLKTGVQSRIPVSTKHQRMASDSAIPSPTNHSLHIPQLSLRALGSPHSSSYLSPSGDKKPPSPRRGSRPPMQIKSPGRRGQGQPSGTGDKSPSLRANIIAPPPKISPPLRSSRPRLPVSSATTTASRAKMAEKFQKLAKQQSDSKSYRRQQPPELTDIDLKARRLKITQALTKSKDGQELKVDRVVTRGSSTSRTNSPTPSQEDSDKYDGDVQEQADIPAVVVNDASVETPEEREFYSPSLEQGEDQRAFTQNALKIVETGSQHPAEGIDSPTLGHARKNFNGIPFMLNTHLQPSREDQEPQSAVTQGTVATEATEGTLIDAEPQADAARLHTAPQSLFSQISHFRSQYSNSPLSSTSHESEEKSDHADEMSVRLMLRDTTYLDDEEAVEKGYRPLPPPAQPELALRLNNDRGSWTSSIEEGQHGSEMANTTVTGVLGPPGKEEGVLPIDSDSFSETGHSSIEDDTSRHTYMSDTYTIVNILLQQQTPSGVVDQQLVDDIYHRIIQTSPDLADAEHVDEAKVQRLCLQELEEYHRRWGQPESSRPSSAANFDSKASLHSLRDAAANEANALRDSADASDSSHIAPPPPPQSYRSHKYKSSLDSAEDWAETSPSVTDWIQFGLRSPAEVQQRRQQSSLARETFAAGEEVLPDSDQGLGQQQDTITRNDTGSLPSAWDSPRPPSHSPPPPPSSTLPSIEHTSWSAPAGVKPVAAPKELPVRPSTAVSQISGRSSIDQQGMPSSSSVARPSTEEQSPEQRRLKQRRHVLKELVDTEYTYERDMRVLCDIYKQTAVAAINEEDTKIIFGNVDLVQQFSKDFLGLLKQVVKPAYVMERSDRRKDGNRTSTLQTSNETDGMGDMTDAEKDELTRVGQAFEASMADMEKAYTDYIRTRHPANMRLEVLQSSSAVHEWLKECRQNSSDITNAWSLDALLVKPIQRITKYPLLLNQLLEATPESHPDVSFLRRVTVEVTEINMRINEVKKHTELVDQVLNRKRKDSDVRNGLTKAFGRRAEKLRQHVGINEMYEDEEYAKLKIKYDNNIAHLFLVSKDCQGYVEAIKQWVARMCELAAAAEAWVDVGHTNYSEAESRLRQFAIVVRGMNSIALPDHVEQVAKRILIPMEKSTTLLERFKTDTKGLIQKREKRLIDYNQFKNKKDRGEKVDKKMTERMEQWEALNLEAKERMKRLLRSTGDLVQSCLASLVELHMDWLGMCKQKFSAAMEIPMDKLAKADLIKDWQEDFDYQEASALTLSICNGSLLAEASNLLSFLTPGSTLIGDDSPRQPSWNSAAKRSVSLNDEGMPVPPPELYHRNSGGLVSTYSEDASERTSSIFGNGRIRATSAASGRIPKTPELGSRGGAASVYTANSTNVSRPGTGVGQAEFDSRAAPRLSLEAPSPSLGPLLTESPDAAKHASTSTFYSATPGPSYSQLSMPGPGGSVFSSAMPMEDSSGPGRDIELSETQQEPGVLFTAASVYEFNIDRSRQQGGFRYLTYVTGEIFDVIAEHGELWLAINQDDEAREIGWIWNKHFAKLAG